MTGLFYGDPPSAFSVLRYPSPPHLRHDRPLAFLLLLRVPWRLEQNFNRVFMLGNRLQQTGVKTFGRFFSFYCGLPFSP